MLCSCMYARACPFSLLNAHSFLAGHEFTSPSAHGMRDLRELELGDIRDFLLLACDGEPIRGGWGPGAVC